MLTQTLSHAKDQVFVDTAYYKRAEHRGLIPHRIWPWAASCALAAAAAARSRSFSFSFSRSRGTTTAGVCGTVTCGRAGAERVKPLPVLDVLSCAAESPVAVASAPPVRCYISLLTEVDAPSSVFGLQQ